MKDLLVAEDRSPFVLHRCHLQKFGVGVIGKISTIPVPRLITSSKLETYRPLVRERRDGDTVEYNAEQSHQDTEEQVSTPSHRDSKYETDINDTGHVNESLSASHQFEYKKFESEISLIMTAGNELVSNEVVVNKVEDSLDVSDVNGNGDCDRGGGDGKDESDDSSYVFVSDGGVDVVSKSDSVEEVDLFKKEENGRISVGDRLDLETNGVENEVKDVKQEACIENGSVVDVNVVVESNDVDQDVKGRVGKVIQEEMVEDGNEIADVEAKTEDIVSAVGSDAECIRDPIEGSESQDTVSQSVSLPDVTNTTDGNEIHDVEAKREDVVSAVDSDEECIQNPVESSESQVTINQSVSTPDLVNERDELVATPIPVENTNGEVMVFDGPESVSDMVEEAECEVIADGSGKSFEDLECQVAVDGLVSSGSSIKEKSELTVDESRNPSDDLECQVTTDGQEATGSSMKEEEAQVTADEPESSGRSMKEQEAQVTVDESGNPSEGLESQATADGLKSCGSAIKEQESEVSVGSVIDNQECPVSVDESEPTGNPTEEVDASSIVMESHGKPEEEHELLSKALEVNVEPELNHVCNGMRSGHVNESLSASHQFEDKKFEGASATESTEYPDSGAVMSEYADDLANRQVVNFDGTLENGEIHISGTEADESVPLRFDGELAKPEEKFEKQAEESSETLVKVTESVEIMANSEDLKEQVKKEDEIQQSQILATDNVQGYLNLEDKTAESANEAEVPLETETNIEPVSHENTRSQSEVSNCSDKPQEGFQTDGSAEIVVTSDPVESECNNEDLPAEKDNDALSNHEDLTVVEQKVQIAAHLGTENESAEDMGCGTGTETADVLDDNEKETEDKDAPVELVADLVKENCSADSGTEIENVDVPDDPEKETVATDVPVADHSTLSFPDTPVAVIEFGSIGRHETLPIISKIDMISSSDAPNGDVKFACGNDSGIPEQNVDGPHGDRNSQDTQKSSYSNEGYNAEQSHQDTEKQVSTPSDRDSKYETDINDTGDTNSLGSLKDGVNGASEQIIEACRTEMLQSPEHVNGSTPRKSWADMAQGGFEADEEEEAKFQFGSFSSQVEEMGEVKVIRKKDFACYERINGKLVNIVDGLELHSNVFSLMEQRRIIDFVFELQEKGKNGKLKARTYTAPQKWMRGKGRVTIQFGCCYNYVTDRNGNPPGILHNTLVDPIPLLFKDIIKRLVKWHILPPTCVPDSCIVNIYDEGDCIPPHIDNHDFLRPFCTVSFLSECNILFGTNLKIEGPGEFSGSFPIPLPTGSVLVLNGNGADVAKHCVPAVPTKRISITFRKMDESKWPIGFVPEPDLQGLEPLPYGSDKPKDNSNLSKPKDNSNFSKPSQPSDRQTVGGNDANIFKPSQQRKIAQGDTRHSHGGSETSHGGPGGGIVQNPEQMLETKSGKPMQAPKSFGIGAKLVSRVAHIKGLEGTTNHRRADGEEDGEFIKPEEPQQQKQLPPPPPPPPLTLGLDPFDPSNLQSDTTQGKSNHTGRPGEGRSGNIGWDLNPNTDPNSTSNPNPSPNQRRSGSERFNSSSNSPRERSHHVEEPGYTRSSRSSSNKQSTLGSGNGNVGWDLNPNPNANPNPNPRRSGGEKYNSNSKSPQERSHHVEEPGYTRTSRSYWNKQSSLGTGSGGGYSKPPSKGQRCRYYESGRCKKGASCKYLHTPK